MVCQTFQFFSSLSSLQREFDNLTKNFYHEFLSNKSLKDLVISPAINFVEDNSVFKVEAEMPGVDENDIQVSITKDILVIKATKKVSRKNENKSYSLREIGYGAYERTIALPDGLDINNVKSSFKKGMLWVEIPKIKTEPQQFKEVKIEKAV